MKLRLENMLFIASCIGLALSIWVTVNPFWMEFFSITTVLTAAVMLPGLNSAAEKILVATVRVKNTFARMLLRSVVFTGLCASTAFGLYYGMWGVMETQAFSLSLGVFSIGGLLFIYNYWGNYWR